MSESVQKTAAAAAFASKEDAEEFLAQRLPSATKGNPRYRTGPGAETAWITKTIRFGPGKNPNGISVSSSEEVLEFRNGVASPPGAHEVEFLIEDVQISERTDSGDVTVDGGKALGVIFKCNSGKCIRSTYDGKPYWVDWSDISIQDETLRAKVLEAFVALKRIAGDRQASTPIKTP